MGVVVAYHADPGHVGARLPLSGDAPLEVGRAPGMFADHTMSRRHARVTLRPAGPEISDLNSRNGTFVNGEPVRRQTLRSGDIVGWARSWFRPPGAPRVSLLRRENLTRLLRALIEARHNQPGRPLTTDALFSAGWPGERIQAPSAAGRVYVALTSLRNLGLREFLVRSEGGYLLDAGANIESIDGATG